MTEQQAIQRLRRYARRHGLWCRVEWRGDGRLATLHDRQAACWYGYGYCRDLPTAVEDVIHEHKANQ